MSKYTSQYEVLPVQGTMHRYQDEERVELQRLSYNRDDINLNLMPVTPTKSKWTSGLKMILVLVAGFIIIGIASAYLTFLWFGQNWFGQTSENLWSRIVLANWVTTSVVISALVIRLVVASQLTLTTSILAMTTLKKGSALSQIPRISSMRYSNGGSLDLLYVLFSSISYNFTASTFLWTLLLTVLTLALQLTSTALVSDLNLALIGTPTNQTNNPVLLNSAVPDPSEPTENRWTDPILSNPVQYPLFAEYSNRSDRSQHLLGDTFDDTGPVVRALLPVAATDGRAGLRTFKGNASIYDARWICERPKLDLTALRLSGDSWIQILSGGLLIDNPSPPMVATKEQLFSCGIEQTYVEDDRWHVITCPISTFGLVSGIDTTYDVTKSYTYDGTGVNETGSPNGPNWRRGYVMGDAFLAINLTSYDFPGTALTDDTGTNVLTNLGMGSDNVRLLNESQLAFDDSNSWVISEHGIWTSLTSTQPGVSMAGTGFTGVAYNYTGLKWNFSLDVSVCRSARTYIKTLHVDAQGHSNGEPISIADGLKQIGATSQVFDFDSRGIMELDSSFRDVLERERIIIRDLEAPSPMLPIFALGDSATPRAWYPFGISKDVKKSFLLGVHESRVELFQRILKETGSLATALQAESHAYVAERYYKYQPEFQNASTQTMTFSQLAIQPVRVRGFWAVVGVLGLYILATLIVVTMVGDSRDWWATINAIDQSWQAYAQVWTLRREVDDILNDTAMTIKTDDQMENDFKRQGLMNQTFVLASDRSGQMKFRRRVT